MNEKLKDKLDLIKRIVDIGFVLSFISVLALVGWKIFTL